MAGSLPPDRTALLRRRGGSARRRWAPLVRLFHEARSLAARLPRPTELILALAALGAGGCSPRPATEWPKAIPQAEAERRVAQAFAADRYVTNQFIPRPGAPPPAPIAPMRRLRVGLQWLLTGDAAPWVVAEKKGFFADQGLDVELEPGGPGRDVLSGVVVGRTDIYVGYPDLALAMVTSRTGADLRLICATMKSTEAGWMGLDRSIPPTQRSTRRIGAADLRGRRIAVQPESDYLIAYVCDQLGLSPSDLQLRRAGSTPDGLLTGALDYFQGLRSDQPRLLERNGYKNWTFLAVADLGYTSYLDVSVVTADFYHREPAVLAGYVAALDHALRYIAGHFHETAELMVQAIPGEPGSVEEMETRIRRETALTFGDGREPLLFIDPAKVRNLVTILYRYHRLDLPGGPE